MEKICEYCGEHFKGKAKQKFCSRVCRGLNDRKRVIVKCSMCGKTIEKTKYQAKRSEYHYCSQECKQLHYKIRFLGENNANFKNKTISLKCTYCGGEILRQECQLKNSSGQMKQYHYCSQECKSKHQKLLLLHNKNPNYKSIKIRCTYCNKEIERTPNYINTKQHLFCSQECWHDWLSENLVGENNPNYDSTISLEDRERGRLFDGYAYWRRQVYKKDSYTCQCCGDNKGHNLNAHHILNYSEYKDLRLDINNGITLCKECHKHFHDTYGYRHNTKEQLQEFLNKYKSILI